VVLRWSRATIAPRVFAFAPPVWHDATKMVTMNNISLQCRSKCLRIRNLFALQPMMRDEIFTSESFMNSRRDLIGTERLEGGAENAGRENDGHEIDGPICRA